MIKYEYVKSGLTLLIVSISMVSCIAQKDSSSNSSYEAYTEHQYNIKLKNDTLLLHFFKKVMSQNDVNRNIYGKVFLEFTVDTKGDVINVIFQKTDRFYISEQVKDSLVTKIKKCVKYDVTTEAKNYYDLLEKPIIINLILLGRSLKSP